MSQTGQSSSPADRLILEHYRRQARDHGLEPTSTMADLTTRELEEEAILACVEHVLPDRGGEAYVLEVGCGNGYLLGVLRERLPHMRLVGLDYSPDMVELARRRGISACQVHQGDVRRCTFEAGEFDVVVSERCLINLLEPAAQQLALSELHRVLRPGGHLVLVEAFTDAAANVNRARAELGLPKITIPHHNLWINKNSFLQWIEPRFEIVNPATADGALPPRNFLSTHYFVSRVLYPAVTCREILYNNEFVRFFRFLPPQGDYSPIQLFLLRKR